jgi:hypothetical protein
LLGLAGWEVAFRWAPDREEVLWRDLRVVHAVNFCSDQPRKRTHSRRSFFSLANT